MPKRSEAIFNFLSKATHSDLSLLYNSGMECQVNVAQDTGRRVDQEFKGRRWQAWTDDIQTWNSFRIPLHANSEPENNDKEMSYALDVHAEAIGLTGWNWQIKKSIWVAFDFDAILGHADGLSNDELQNIIKIASDIEWVTVRKSTSGKGLHLYVFLDPVETQNHNEHAALARAILGKMAALTGYDFHSKVDICGGNMWVWHRKLTGDGLKLIKQGSKLFDIPINWKDHISIISKKSNKINAPKEIPEDKVDLFDQLTGQRPIIQLDESHKKLIEWLNDNNCVWWWVQDQHMLVTHTIHLQEAHVALGFKGIFKTKATGKDKGNDHNCFCYPNRGGSWIVRRYTPGISEEENWYQDSSGWTSCKYNIDPDLDTASKAFGGIESPNGGFVFREAEVALKAANLLGIQTELPTWAAGRETKIKYHKDGRRIVLEIEQRPGDPEFKNWLPDKGKWKRVMNTQNFTPAEAEVGNFDDLVRHIVTETHDDYGWVIKSDNLWRNEPLVHVGKALKSTGYDPKTVDNIIGSSVMKCWTLTNKPFQPEYPGNRQWNRGAAQLRFAPSNNDQRIYTHWKMILDHCGFGLNNAVKENGWCKANGILTGSDYLKCWIASVFQFPMEPLPYLFFYSPEQNTGKSIFHEALSLLLTKGIVRADSALINQSGFNGELENAIICVVEETDLGKNPQAYNRIKDWVTSKHLPIHKKQKTPYTVPNTSHWVQMANNYTACPVFTGDTRITMIRVEPLDPLIMIPKAKMLPMLEKEAPDFISEILKLELPAPNDRLNIPVIVTEDKLATEDLNLNSLQRFIKDHYHNIPGTKIKYTDFFDKFKEWLEPNEVHQWTIIRVGRELGPKFPKGRSDGSQFYIGNITDNPQEKPSTPLVLFGDKLIPKC